MFSPLEQIRKSNNLPCVAAGSSNYATSTFETTGVRKIGAAPAAEKTDKFLLGSLSKAMTATLIALLVKDGLFTWEQTLGELLRPQLPNMHPSHEYTTLEMLASHYSGLAMAWELRVSLLARLWDSTVAPEQGRWIGVQDALAKPPKYKPGSKFVYDNTNYYVLSVLVDRFADSPWETVIRERLFEPLGMDEIGFGAAPERDDTSIDNPWPHLRNPFQLAQPIPVSLLPLRYREWPLAGAPAGSVHCTIQNYNTFLRMHVDGGNGTSVLGLSPADFRFLHTPFKQDGVGYSPGGWYRPPKYDRGEEAYSLYHAGANPFNQTYAWLDIGDGRADAYMAMINVGLSRTPTPAERITQALRQNTLILNNT